jgi:hypothetical protein
MKFSGRFKSRLEVNVGIGGCVSPQPRIFLIGATCLAIAEITKRIFYRAKVEQSPPAVRT